MYTLSHGVIQSFLLCGVKDLTRPPTMVTAKKKKGTLAEIAASVDYCVGTDMNM